MTRTRVWWVVCDWGMTRWAWARRGRLYRLAAGREQGGATSAGGYGLAGAQSWNILSPTLRVITGMKVHTVDLPDIDAIDRRIIIELQNDGRMTNVELARRAGISAPPCLRRVRRLEETGIIRGYHAETDPQMLGFAITFFVIIGLDTQKDAALAAFERLVATWPEVRECHMIRGGGDFLIRLVARDTAQENELTRKLTEAPGVATVRSLQTIRTSRTVAGVPL